MTPRLRQMFFVPPAHVCGFILPVLPKIAAIVIPLPATACADGCSYLVRELCPETRGIIATEIFVGWRKRKIGAQTIYERDLSPRATGYVVWRKDKNFKILRDVRGSRTALSPEHEDLLYRYLLEEEQMAAASGKRKGFRVFITRQNRAAPPEIMPSRAEHAQAQEG